MKRVDYLVVLNTEKGERVEIKDTLREAKQYLQDNVDHKEIYIDGVIYSKTWYYHPEMREPERPTNK